MSQEKHWTDNVIELRVAIPQQRSDNHGVNSTRGEGAERKDTRYPAHELAAIKKWCNILQMSFSSFVRDAAYNATIALDKLEKDHANQSDNGDRR